jgi:endonuclease/exonuclease/phosphatase family metal-dependent hydrolase
MNLRFATWNINNRKYSKKHEDFIKALGIDILALQECSQDFFTNAMVSGLYSSCSYSLDLRTPLPEEGMSRRLGCAILSNRKICSTKLVESVDFLERTLVCEIDCESKQLLACSFHMPPGVSWGRVKPETFIKLSEWLSSNTGTTVAGMDANAPKSDMPNLEDNEWWWDEEPLFLGKEAFHSLKDSYRIFLEQNPDIRNQVVKENPKGPLAISHVRGRGKNRTPCRYDFVLVSPDISVDKVQYLYDESVEAGSDHALVLADVKF